MRSNTVVRKINYKSGNDLTGACVDVQRSMVNRNPSHIQMISNTVVRRVNTFMVMTLQVPVSDSGLAIYELENDVLRDSDWKLHSNTVVWRII